MNLEIFASAVLALLALSGLSVSLLIAGLNRQLQLQRETLKATLNGLCEVYSAECEILDGIKTLQTGSTNRAGALAAIHCNVIENGNALHRIRVAIGDLPPDEPKSLGLSPTPVKLTPPARDPEAEARKRRRNRNRSRQTEAVK